MTACYGLIVLVALACFPSSAAFYQLWTDTANLSGTHGFLIAAVMLWLIFDSRDVLIAAPAKSSQLALVALGAALLGWLVAWKAGLEVLHLLAFPVVLWCAAFALFGWPVARLLLFPIGYLLFAVPVWEPLSPPLAELTLHVVNAWLVFTDIPGVVEGRLVTLPNGVFEITDGCSGVHFLVVGLAVAAFYGAVSRQSVLTRVGLLVLMGSLALICNWVRVYTIIKAGYETDMRHYIVAVSHYGYGWILFALFLGLFLWIAGKTPHAVQPVESTAARAPRRDTRHDVSSSRHAQVLGVLLLAPAILWATSNTRRVDSSLEPLRLPLDPSPWHGPASAASSDWQPVFAGADLQQLGVYRDTAGAQVEWFVAAFRTQVQGAELIGSANSLLGSRGLTETAHAVVNVGNARFIEMLARDAQGRSSVIWSVYTVGGRSFVTPLAAQLWYGVRALAGHPVSTVHAYRSVCASDCDAARAMLARAVSASSMQKVVP